MSRQGILGAQYSNSGGPQNSLTAMRCLAGGGSVGTVDRCCCRFPTGMYAPGSGRTNLRSSNYSETLVL